LHFYDLRREFGSRLLESGASQHIVRDFLGHANISTTSRYLATTPIALEHAIRQFEAHQLVNAPLPEPQAADSDRYKPTN
jgi:site-specific recombinase XerD